MSRQSELQQTVTNPVHLRITWKSTEKRFVSYNTLTKQKTVLGDIKFIVLSETISICGYNEQQNMGIFSNEIKNTQSEELIVKTKNGILAQGFYSDIKTNLSKLGGSFANNLYVLLNTGELAVIQLSGAALKVWFEYKDLNSDKIVSNWVTITGVNDLKKGAVKYSVPVLTVGAILSDKEDTTAEEQHNKIMEYRKSGQTPKLSGDAVVETDDIPWD